MTPVQAMSFEKAAKLFMFVRAIFLFFSYVVMSVLPYCGYRCKGDVIWGTSVV